MAGRPRKPAKQKILQGTFHKYRNPENEAQYNGLSKMPPPPKHLNEHGKRLWVDCGAELVASGVITGPDIIAFEMLCETYGRYKLLEAYNASNLIANVEGEHGGRSPQAQQMNADFALCEKMMTHFGLTPASRNKFGVSKKKDEDPDIKKMKELLGA